MLAQSAHISSIFGEMLLKSGRLSFIYLILGGAIMLLGVLRFLGFLPNLSLNLLTHRNQNQVVVGTALLLIGGIIVIIGIVR